MYVSVFEHNSVSIYGSMYKHANKYITSSEERQIESRYFYIPNRNTHLYKVFNVVIFNFLMTLPDTITFNIDL